MPAAHDVYVEQLNHLQRGHPLYYPEPHPVDGEVEIGDVGYTDQGAFCRLFSVCRPPDHPMQTYGVPDGFVQLHVGNLDTFEAALEPGPLHSRAVSSTSVNTGTPGEILPAEASFHFTCTSERGAILVLETQMMRQKTRQHHHLGNHLRQHCHAWHAFAKSKDIYIGFGDLMLVTGCSKTAAWSSAVYSNNSTQFGLAFSVGMPFATAGIAASNNHEIIGPIERRRSQGRAQPLNSFLPKNHTVFVEAFRVGMRQMYKHSLVSFFMKSRNSTVSENRRTLEGASEVGRLASTSSQHFPQPPVSSESVITRPYESDFDPSVALLGLAMEANNDSEIAMVHDSFWRSASPESEESQIIEEYTNFYFSEKGRALSGALRGFAVQQPPVISKNRDGLSGNLDYLVLNVEHGPKSSVGSMTSSSYMIHPRIDLTGKVVKLYEHPSRYTKFSEVYEGILTETNEHVTIKVPRIRVTSVVGGDYEHDIVGETTKPIIRETHVWHALDHESVLRLLGLSNDLGPLPAFISPFCQNGDASLYLKTHPETNRPLMIFRIAEGLAYLHSKSVIHGNLTPESIVIDENGRPLLCDFSQSRILGLAEFDIIHPAGVPRYMAPELLKLPVGESVITKETDVYSLGMVGLEIISGNRPFHHARSDMDVIISMFTGRNPVPRQPNIAPEHKSTWSVLEACSIRESISRPSMVVVVERLQFN